MSTAIPFKLTVAGQDAAFNLGAIVLNITHVQLGSGNRIANGNETALVTPQEAVAISGHFEVSVGQHRIAAVVPGSVSTYQVSEIGLWSGVPGTGGSVLAFYWSMASSYIAVKSASVDFNFESDLFFGGVVPGNITIVADTSFNALAMLAAHEADLGAHPSVDTPPLGDNDQSPVNSEWVQQTIGKVLSKSVAGSANVALTAVEAGHGILQFSGILTENVAVIVPVSPTRSWIVKNDTTGAFALTVKTPTGTGVVVPKTGALVLYCNGTNVYAPDNGVVLGPPINVTASRSSLTVYTNQSSKTKWVLITIAATTTTTPFGAAFVVDGVTFFTIRQMYPNLGQGQDVIGGPVPPGSTYQVTGDTGVFSTAYWTELG